MLKTRLIPVLYIRNGLIVRSENFSYHQNIGNVINEAKRYNEWDVDELIYIDISRDKQYDARRDDHKIQSFQSIEQIISAISSVCFMPLTFGGGIRTIEQVDFIIRSGSDKITLNTGAFNNPELVKETSLRYGSQCIVLSIDYRTVEGKPIVFTEFGEKNTGVKVVDWVNECEKLGAGEIFLNSIERDGTAMGYDIETIGQIVESTRLPVIACGGVGDASDFVELAKNTRVSALAAGNWFHFVERSYSKAKQLLKKHGINVR